MLKTCTFILTVLIFTIFSNHIHAADINETVAKEYSLGFGGQFGRVLYVDGDAPGANNFFEMDVLGKYYLSQKILLRSGLGFEYRPFADNLQNPKPTISFNGELGFEFHFTPATTIA